jgi:hypothetical protein
VHVGGLILSYFWSLGESTARSCFVLLSRAASAFCGRCFWNLGVAFL